MVPAKLSSWRASSPEIGNPFFAITVEIFSVLLAWSPLEESMALVFELFQPFSSGLRSLLFLNLHLN
jgi:hypothetical protein